jgi:hypothetical protein
MVFEESVPVVTFTCMVRSGTPEIVGNPTVIAVGVQTSVVACGSPLGKPLRTTLPLVPKHEPSRTR